MQLPPRRWLEPALVAAISLALVAAFWAAWQRTGGAPDEGRHVVDARGLAIPPQQATAGPLTPTPAPSATASPRVTIEKAHRAYASANRSLRARVQAQVAALSSHTDLVLATYNMLGDSHTRAGGDKRRMAAGSVRARWAADSLLAHDVDVASLQELQRPQAESFVRVAGATYDVWPGIERTAREGENSVAWRRDRFEAVERLQNVYPYFGGNGRPYPMVLLRDRSNGVEFWVTSNHNPAFPQNTAWKHRALAAEITATNTLLGTPGHAPLVFAGDMNDRSAFFCAYAGSTAMHAANGGSAGDGSCTMPTAIPEPYAGIDWIMGSPGVEFTAFGWDSGAVNRRTSDHPLVYASARIWKDDRAPVGSTP